MHTLCTLWKSFTLRTWLNYVEFFCNYPWKRKNIWNWRKDQISLAEHDEWIKRLVDWIECRRICCYYKAYGKKKYLVYWRGWNPKVPSKNELILKDYSFNTLTLNLHPSELLTSISNPFCKYQCASISNSKTLRLSTLQFQFVCQLLSWLTCTYWLFSNCL